MKKGESDMDIRLAQHGVRKPRVYAGNGKYLLTKEAYLVGRKCQIECFR